MGSYYHSFLIGSEPAGLHENQFAMVRTINNRGDVTDDEWIVNCNDSFPQVVRPSGENIQISLTESPPSFTQTSHELWWAVCRTEFAKYSFESLETATRIKPEEVGLVAIEDGRKLNFEVLPMGNAAAVTSLAKIHIAEGRRGKGEEAVFIYCSSSVPTVSWPGELIELSVADDQGRYDKATVMVSDALYRLTCGRSAERYNVAANNMGGDIFLSGGSGMQFYLSDMKKFTVQGQFGFSQSGYEFNLLTETQSKPAGIDQKTTSEKRQGVVICSPDHQTKHSVRIGSDEIVIDIDKTHQQVDADGELFSYDIWFTACLSEPDAF